MTDTVVIVPFPSLVPSGTALATTLGRLSLDPIDRSPFGHVMKFTQRSFPRYVLGLSIAFYRLGLSTAFTD